MGHSTFTAKILNEQIKESADLPVSGADLPVSGGVSIGEVRTERDQDYITGQTSGYPEPRGSTKPKPGGTHIGQVRMPNDPGYPDETIKEK